MKTIKTIGMLIFITILACWPVLANLTVTVQPGYTFGAGEVPTIDKLNQLGEPTIGVTGTLDGSTSLAAGTVTGILLADSVPDSVTIGYNASLPRQLQVLGAGVAGWGLIQSNTTQLALNIDPTLAWNTNSPTTNAAVGVNQLWAYRTVWQPWVVWPYSTNTPYTNALAGVTNVYAITNIVNAGFPAPTLTATDQIPVLTFQQGGSNTVTTLGALAQAVDAANLKLIGTYTFSGTTISNDVVTALALTDGYGQHSVLSTTYAVTVSTNTTLTNLAARVTAAINGTPSTPKYTAVWSGVTVLVYEPLVWYPQTGSSAQNNFTTGSSLAVAWLSANTPALVANCYPYSQTASATSGLHGYTSGTITAGVAGGIPPYAYSWSTPAVNFTGGWNTKTGSANTSSSSSTTVTATLNPSGGAATFTVTAMCTVTDSSGQIATPTQNSIWTFP